MNVDFDMSEVKEQYNQLKNVINQYIKIAKTVISLLYGRPGGASEKSNPEEIWVVKVEGKQNIKVFRDCLKVVEDKYRFNSRRYLHNNGPFLSSPVVVSGGGYVIMNESLLVSRNSSVLSSLSSV